MCVSGRDARISGHPRDFVCHRARLGRGKRLSALLTNRLDYARQAAEDRRSTKRSQCFLHVTRMVTSRLFRVTALPLDSPNTPSPIRTADERPVELVSR